MSCDLTGSMSPCVDFLQVSKELKVYQEVALANYVKKLVKLVG